MIVAIAALIVALGGTSFAQDAVKAPLAGMSALLKGSQIKKNSIPGNRVKRNSLTGRQIRESSLGAVPTAGNAGQLDRLDSSAFLRSSGKAVDADKLDGTDSSGFLSAGGKAADADKLDALDSSSFVQGGGTIAQRRLQIVGLPTTDTQFLTVPGFGRMEVFCSDLADTVVTFRNTSGGTVNSWLDTGADEPVHLAVVNNGTHTAPTVSGVNNDEVHTWTLAAGSGDASGAGSKMATVTVGLLSGVGGAAECLFAMQAIAQG